MEDSIDLCPPVAIPEKPEKVEVDKDNQNETTDRVKTLEKRIEELEKRRELETENLRKELKQKELEVEECKKRETKDSMIQCEEISQGITTLPQKREETVAITEENKWRVNKDLGGMIWNDDETYSRTPQSNTWVINKKIQLKDLHM